MTVRSILLLFFIGFFVFVYPSVDVSGEALAKTDKPTFVMINPAGHAKNVGRKLPFGDYERSVTFEFAKRLQDELQKTYNVRAILTRFIGEEILDPLQNTSFANRLGVDFYLSLHICGQESGKPRMFMYQLVYNPMVDLAYRVIDPFAFIPLSQAHYANIYKTKFLGERMKEILTLPKNQKRFDFYGIYGIPIRPLCGILSPAITIEIGIRDEYQWKSLVEPIVESLSFLKEDL